MRSFRFALGVVALLAVFASASRVVEAADRATAAQAAGIPFKTDEPDGADLAFRVAGVLVVLLGGTVAVLYWLARSRGKTLFPAKGERRLQVVDSLRLNPRTALYVVRFDGRDILLAQSGERVVQIDGAAAPHAPARLPDSAAPVAGRIDPGTRSDSCAR